jgi:hypothetical protein
VLVTVHVHAICENQVHSSSNSGFRELDGEVEWGCLKPQDGRALLQSDLAP